MKIYSSSMKIRPSFDEIRELVSSGDYGVVPVSCEVLSDMRTPLEVLRVLQNISNHVYLLESVSGHEEWGRYTFIGYDPKIEIACQDKVMRAGAITFHTDDPGSYIRQVLSLHKSPKLDYLPSFTGGLVGYFSYDYLKYSEPTLNLNAEDTEGFKDVDLMLFDKVICFDNYRQKMILIVNMTITEEARKGANSSGNGRDGISVPANRRGMLFSGENNSEENITDNRNASRTLDDIAVASCESIRDPHGLSSEEKLSLRSLEAEYNRSCLELHHMADLVRNGDMADIVPGKMVSEVKGLFSKEQYCSMVEKAKKHIYEGDIFQVVLSNRLEAEYEGSLLNTYRILRTVNPSPYMFYFASSDLEVAGASPETLVKLQDGVLHTFPLAGTRPRGNTPQEDDELEKELLSDTKELAEHSMLVDLGRNDIGKVSKFGSVCVEKAYQIERFSHVMHIGSTVRGQIRDDCDALDAVASILPAGTLSGAPKIMAAQIINDLECNKRGIYGGAIGYISFTGNLDLCIAIRIAYKKNGKVFVRSGAGIVADSVPEKEYQECLNKAKALVVSLEKAQRDEL